MWGLQWARQTDLDRKAATLPLGAGYEQLQKVMGPPSEILQTEGTAVYCYSCGFPYSLIHPDEWQFEFLQNRLIDKQSTSTKPRW